mmetsp:Transcript_303/g.424  ORF Transcript_303/g.424 Transcript_303/m.424 type:complete len:641 (+) Transcript_303:125-2047(+)|eukprot:CAMPEP_0194220848 /NCGR_PEP_ID=MMETSP0156-20130528/29329_1 /TAXON_ID=33649 /ORGANISM="Thalassionema nitzschioides, Strain L26-B" /LENGTH=640 /DNA_ID=CAMNT_0038951053 /DNA_START=50 /DNA_END=1972 /DNA_ORIENTATION=-
MLFITLLKPIAFVWFGFKVLDDVSIITRVLHLTLASLNTRGDNNNKNEALCDVCDDVMGDLLVQEGVAVLPCRLLCFQVPACVQMCEHLKTVSHTSTKFPCVAAGYCDATEEEYFDSGDTIDCQVGRFFSCTPSRYCRRVRQGWRWSCRLRPGIGRWVGLTHAVSTHAGAMAHAIMEQPHCSESDADASFCIASPRGVGLACEIITQVLSLVYGGYQSILAIESIGGDDDTQWLTYHVMAGTILVIEKLFARPILSTFPFYYEMKLVIILWLLCCQGAERTYRQLRRFFIRWRWIQASDATAERTLDQQWEQHDKKTIQRELIRIRQMLRNKVRKSYQRTVVTNKSFRLLQNWESYETNEYRALAASEVLYQLCLFVVSPKGIETLRNAPDICKEEQDLFWKQASYYLHHFTPKYLYIRRLRVASGEEGALPPMDSNGLADPYITCRLVTSTKKKKSEKKEIIRGKLCVSSTLYRTKRPKWNDLLELPLIAGYIDEQGVYQNDHIESTVVEIQVWDKDVGLWGMVLRFAPVAFLGLTITLIVGYVTDNKTFPLMEQQILVQRVFGGILILLALSYIMSVIRKADDDFIGQCTVPLEILKDRRERVLLLPLRPSPTQKKAAPTNSSGRYGIIQATFVLTQR